MMLSFNPFWRGETVGSYALVFNTLMQGISTPGKNHNLPPLTTGTTLTKLRRNTR